ncbi:uncharacterized protein LOC116199120 [Punica granatum]|uniref:FAF domain-containing protein n=2 Tax=Punica granatum TaxID=22663 RepID=A0A218WLD4_PUNGR|nr:uncharacterized protein LOC116199120 [Punica granatum]OWM73647.1 hypothetical protein CDL15_Pgr026746 [Punica granatum]PKI53703.1 hypothetical protein CRG98_025944 [Punica granatum]
MAVCESIQQVFETPSLPEKPALIETLSPWKNKVVEKSPSFTEIFGELRFQEDPEPSSLFDRPLPMSSGPPSVVGSDVLASGVKDQEEETEHSISQSVPSTPKSDYLASHRKSDSFSSMNSESLQLCTEGLGLESFDDLEDLRIETDENCQFREERRRLYSPSGRLSREFRRSRSMGAGFPPPIPSLSMTGKPWVCFKSYRHDGRFVLKEIRFPTQEFLQASREDGRLRLHFVQPKDEVLEEEAEDEAEEVEERGPVEDRDGGDGKEGVTW